MSDIAVDRFCTDRREHRRSPSLSACTMVDRNGGNLGRYGRPAIRQNPWSKRWSSTKFLRFRLAVDSST